MVQSPNKIIGRPARDEYPDVFETYIKLVPGDRVMKTLQDSILDLQQILSEVPEEYENSAMLPANGHLRCNRPYYRY